MQTLPLSITSVSLHNCLGLTTAGVTAFLERIGPQLVSFSALYPLSLSSAAFDDLFQLCPALTSFQGFVDYFTRTMFHNIPGNHPLESLELDSAGGLLDRENKISADDVSFAIVEGRLSHLRSVRWSLQVGWRKNKSDVRDLGDLLADAAGIDK